MRLTTEQSTLILATVHNNLNLIRKLHEENRVDLNFKDEDGRSLLHYVALSPEADWRTARYFLDEKLDPNEIDYNGNTPLHLNFFNTNPDFIKELLDNGANPWIVNQAGFSVIDQARYDDRLTSYQSIFNNFNNETIDYENHLAIYKFYYMNLRATFFKKAINAFDLERLKSLKQPYEDLNMTWYPENALHTLIRAAAYYSNRNYIPFAKYLVDEGVDLKYKEIGFTAFTLIDDFLERAPYLQPLHDYIHSLAPSFYTHAKDIFKSAVTLFSSNLSSEKGSRSHNNENKLHP